MATNDFAPDFEVAPPAVRTSYKADKGCVVCSEPFGLLALSKKHYCKFCYRGVCANCSLHRALHPERQQKLRLCDACFVTNVESSVRRNFQADLDRERNEVQAFEEVLEAEQRAMRTAERERKDLVDRLESTKLTNKEWELEKLMDVERLVRENAQLNERVTALEAELQKAKQAAYAEDQRLVALRQLLEDSRAELSGDKKRVAQIEELIQRKAEETARVSEALHEFSTGESKSEYLRQNIQRTREEVKDLKSDNKELAQRLAALKRQREAKDGELHVLSKEPSEHSALTLVEDDYERLIRELLDKIIQQKQEIHELKRRSMNSTAAPEDRCTCYIQ